MHNLTDWDVVLPAFERALDKMDKIHLQSKETAIKYLKSIGGLDPDEPEDENPQSRPAQEDGPESTI